MLIRILGFVASVISFVLWLPQARITWVNRHNPEILKGISIGTQFLVMSNATIWAVYAVLENSIWIGVPGLVNFPLALITVIIVHKAIKKEASLAEAKVEDTAIKDMTVVTV